MVSNNINKNIETWISKKGFPFEMEIARAFQSSGFIVTISDFYVDYETNDSREIDIIALRNSDREIKTPLQVCINIECKSSREKPWVLFVSDAQPEHFIPFHTLCSKPFKSFLYEMYPKLPNWKEFNKSPILNPNKYAHSITQAFSSGKDLPFEAIMKTIKSAIYRVNDFDKRIFKSHNKYYNIIVFPTIVIDTRLFECTLDKADKITINEVQSGVLFWKGINPITSSSIIQIVTKPAINDFINHVNHFTDFIIKLTEDYTDLLYKFTQEVLEAS